MGQDRGPGGRFLPKHGVGEAYRFKKGVVGSGEPYRDAGWLGSRYRGGIPVSKIAREAECSESVIWKWIRKYGITREAEDGE